jgi:hypothetical protein
MTKDIVELYQSHISLDTREGEFTELTLPLVEAAVPAA